MKIVLVGDIHGDWTAFNAFMAREKPDLVLQTGDFGFWPGRGNLDPLTMLMPGNSTIHWIEGNHEDHEEIYEELMDGGPISPNLSNVIYQPRGSTIKLPDGRTVLFAGGAFSVDNAARQPGWDWFPDYEILQDSDLVNFPDPKQVQIDIVISHTAPHEFAVSGLPWEQWPKWWDKTPDPSQRVLSNILRRYQPKQWFLGHFHSFNRGTFERCKWTALGHLGGAETWWIELD